MESLKREHLFFYFFVTDLKELTMMVANPEDWQRFQPKLSELAELRKSFSEFDLVY